jgi:cytochrome P450
MALISLAAHPKIQKKLRNELLSLNTDSPTMEELNSLTYLDSIVREVLQFHSIIPFQERLAVQDDIIPVETPYMDRYGKIRDHIA